MLSGKLGAESKGGRKHDTWNVFCGDVYVGTVLDSHGKGELTGREIGNIARSLRLNEHQLKELQRCTMSKDDFCATATSR
jgi:hypothetical protein